MKRTLNYLLLTGLFLTSVFIFPRCEDPEDIIDTVIGGMGWFGDTENMEEIETDINLGTGEVPEQVDLLSKFPPIGNQGSYGTCVAWSVGYNMRTFLDACDNEYSSTQLAQSAHQFSPKDLFWSIGLSDKGEDCNGTSFESAFDMMLSRGIARMSTVPYESLGDCSSSPQTSWTSDANDYLIESYRKISIDVETIKYYLAQGRAVSIGAKLGDGFMNWNNSNVLVSDNDTYNGQHAYHAMILSGYDDYQGPNGAFRVVNSWGTNWGDNGYIWVDYNFFVNTFCFAAFVAKTHTSDPDDDNDNQVDDDEIVTGNIDLIGWELEDYDHPDYTDPRVREIIYNVFNTGDETIYASNDWNIVYIYYNAYDANEWDILLYDYYTDDYDDTDHNGPLSDYPEAYQPGLSDNWWNNIDIPGGVSVAQALYGGEDSRFVWGYIMPEYVNGQYYLAIVADGFDDISEYDETNNYYFFTQDNGDPLTINNGVIDDSKISLKKITQQAEKPDRYSQAPSSDPRSEKNRNTYSPEEIIKMIDHHRETGALASKVKKFKEKLKKRSLY